MRQYADVRSPQRAVRCQSRDLDDCQSCEFESHFQYDSESNHFAAGADSKEEPQSAFDEMYSIISMIQVGG